MPFETLAAELVSEFHLTLEQIGRLTPWQVRDVYYHPRNKDGSIKRPRKHTQGDRFEEERRQFVSERRALFLSDEAIEREWVASVEKRFGLEL